MRNQFRGGVQPFPLRLEMTVQRGEKTALRRSMIVPRPATIVQPGETIVQRVETTVPRHQVYRLLRAVDRDAWLREVISFADSFAIIFGSAFTFSANDFLPRQVFIAARCTAS